jgi:hypothetical protein
MAETTFRKFYLLADFVAMAGAPPVAGQVQTALDAIGQIVLVGSTFNQSIFVEWPTLPSAGDLLAVGAVVAAFTGSSTTSAPIIVTSAQATTTTGAAVSKLTLTTPPLDAGTYQIIFSCQIRMTAVVAGEAARAISTINGVSQQDHWGESVLKAYNGAATIQRTAGQTITVDLSIQEVGPGVGTAEMSQARISVDKL